MLLILAPAAISVAPYASITFAEGSSFMLIRDNVSVVWKVSDSKVFGMEIKPGDIINTAGSTFLELSVYPIQATVQIAENTSYCVAADGSGKKSSGELYYGRVRAKVAKLSGASSFRISSPSLVAGVRGTDFGCDVIVSRDAKKPVLNRVFCFEGSVSVTENSPAPVGAVSAPEAPESVDSPANAILIGVNEMVERSVLAGQDTSAQQTQVMTKSSVSEEVHTFWEAHPVVAVQLPVPVPTPEESAVASESRAAAQPGNGWVVTDRVWPVGATVRRGDGNPNLLSLASITCVFMGSFLCVSLAGTSQSGALSSLQLPLYIAGGSMVGAGALAGVLSPLFN